MPAPDLWRTARRGTDTTGVPDADLLARFSADRDEAAFELLVYRHGPLVWATCRRRLADRHAAEDAFQAAFLALARQAASIRHTAAVPAWLHRVAVRAAARVGRRAPATVVTHAEPVDPGPGPAVRAAAADALDQLDAAVDRLPDRLRHVFVACELRGDSLAAAAARLGCPVGTVASRLGRARARLRSALTARGIISGALAGLAASEPVPSTVRAAAVRGAVEPTAVRPEVAALARQAVPVGRARVAVGLAATLAVGLAAVAVALGQPGDPRPGKEPPAVPKPAGRPLTDAERVAGVWLAADAEAQMDRPLGRVWFSTFRIDGDRFHVSKFFFHPKGLTGTFTLDPTTSPKSVDLKVNELDYADVLGEPAKVPAGTLKGIYKLDGDRLIVCFPIDAAAGRPTEFKGGKRVTLLTLGRARADFKELPKEVAVTVLGPDGKPVANATTYYVMTWNDVPPDKKAGDRPAWQFGQAHAADKDGVARVPYEDIGQSIRAASLDRKLIGYVRTSPFALQTPAVTVRLEPAVRVTGSIENDELKKAGLPVGWTNTTVSFAGTPAASSMTTGGKFDIPLPPGEYELNVYGESVAVKKVPVTVPAGQTELALPPVKPPALALALLKGKPAPELAGVVGWKGEKVRLADLKGKVVLLEFWGYWCGPCIHSMPVLFELHDKFKDQGLAIVGVHLDADGEVDTAARLDEHLVDIRKKLWKGRDLPFPVALCSGRVMDVDGGRLRAGGVQYGIVGYPTTILIGRDGKVVGKFSARDAAAAVEQMKKLLAGE